MMVIVVLAAISCTKGGELERINSTQYTVTSLASSRQLVPGLDTTFSGTFNGFYDEQGNGLTFTIGWKDLWGAAKDTIISVNFYGPAGPAENGPLVRSLPFVSTHSASSINLGLAGIKGFTADERKDFLAGAWYFTINTKKYPNGIIRGQLAPTKQ
ncbi:CHRD domain-containing protein [Chitinophaga jiangningensis]|uniref:CHRD domain-containing protein n=2 Tax=Chitinophaga jiangningensis TaxID=1419482 RepID=A0A1M7JAM3_9BACT|nr:CHRD domain-containing protein [Chitinophaga jiangningensis]